MRNLPALEDGNLHSLKIVGAYYQIIAVPGGLSVRRRRTTLGGKREIENWFSREAAHACRAVYARQFLYALQGFLQKTLQGAGLPYLSTERVVSKVASWLSLNPGFNCCSFRKLAISSPAA